MKEEYVNPNMRKRSKLNQALSYIGLRVNNIIRRPFLIGIIAIIGLLGFLSLTEISFCQNKIIELNSLVSENIHDSKDWIVKRENIKKHLLSYLGPFPSEKTKLNPKIIYVKNIKGIIVKKVKYMSESNDMVYAYLLIPRNKRGKLPAVLALHQTGPYGKEETVGLFGSPDLDYGMELAKRGFIVLVPDSLSVGDRLGKGEDAWSTEKFYRKHPYWSAVGKSIWDNMISIDYLQTLPYVDKERIGVIGHSQGGIYAYFLAAFDERVKATVANCSLMTIAGDPDPFRWVRDSWWVGIPKLGNELKEGRIPFDIHEVIALIAPRAFLSINGSHDDIIPHYQGALAIEERISELYRILNKPDNLQVIIFSGKHSFPLELRTLAYNWLDSQLQTEHKTSLIKQIVNEMLTAYESGKISEGAYYGSTSWDSPAHYALAYLTVYQYSSKQEYLEKALDLLDRAIKSHYVDKNGYWGWGLGETYDAYSDGTINEKNTAYSYTTALMGKAFLEAYSLTRNEKYLNAAQKTAEGLVKSIGYDSYEDGLCFRYSNSPYDREKCIHNVNISTVSFLSSIDTILKSSQHENEIKNAISHSLAKQLDSGNWFYMDGGKTFNDLTHLALQVSDLLRLFENTGNSQYLLAATKAIRSMNGFIAKDGELIDKGIGALWSLGETLIAYKLAIDYGSKSSQQLLEQLLSWTIRNYNQEGYIFDKNPISQSWIVYGLATNSLKEGEGHKYYDSSKRNRYMRGKP